MNPKTIDSTTGVIEKETTPLTPTTQYSLIGKSVPRTDALEKVTGAAKFVDDLKFGPSMLYAKLLRSPHPHARIIKVDTREAEKMPGVKAVVTGKEFSNTIGLYIVDRTLYASDKVRFVGEPVAGVAATSEEIAEEACKKIKVTYEILPSVFNPIEATKDGAPILHEKLGEYECANFIFPKPGTNISNHFKIRKGNVEESFKNCAAIFEDTFTVPHVHHSPLETHIAVGLQDVAGKITLWTSSQSPFAQRNLLCKALNIPYKDLQVITPYIGGGFGCKAGVSIEACILPLAMKAKGRPVKLRLSREEEFFGNFVRQSLIAKVKIGVSSDGKLQAINTQYYRAAGAYTEYGVNITRASGYSSTGPYYIPNVSADSYCVYTNHPVGGPMRGFGMPEIHWALEQGMDSLCRQMKWDPVQFRLDNVVKGGDIIATGMTMHPTGLRECIKNVARDIEWDKPLPKATADKRYGRGIAVMWKAPAMPPNAASSAFLKFNEDATINLAVSGMELGQGTHTVMAQIAGEVLGMPFENFRVHCPNTDFSPYEWQTVASRLTWSMGNAVKEAAIDARNQIYYLVSNAWGVEPSELYIKEGYVYCKTKSDKKIAVKEVAIYGLYFPDGKLHGGPIIGRGRFIPPDVSPLDKETGQGPKAVVHYTTGAQAVIIEVDTETGKIKVLKTAASYDCGKAINPMNVKQQTEGGVAMGISTALFEELTFNEKGCLRNGNFVDYKLATSMDVPMDIVGTYEEVAQSDGPFGARGVGEHTMVPTAPAISNAVYDAVGVRIKSMPLTAEKVYQAIKEKK